MNAIEIIEKHLEDACEKREAAYKKVMQGSATASDWNEYNKTLETCITLRRLYLDVMENELGETKKMLGEAKKLLGNHMQPHLD